MENFNSEEMSTRGKVVQFDRSGLDHDRLIFLRHQIAQGNLKVKKERSKEQTVSKLLDRIAVYESLFPLNRSSDYTRKTLLSLAH
jgi:hypothetical protein